MANCSKCGTHVDKLTFIPGSQGPVCAKCAQRAETFPFTDEELSRDEHDQRRSIRIPISIGIHFHVGKQDMVMTYPATTVNVSTSGLCFAWAACPKCTGYEENSIHKKCFFFPYSTLIKEKKREAMDLKLSVTPTQQMAFKAHIVYTLKDRELKLEYVGACFDDTTPEQSRFLENLLIKFGNNS